jgi:hypothetical protein
VLLRLLVRADVHAFDKEEDRYLVLKDRTDDDCKVSFERLV